MSQQITFSDRPVGLELSVSPNMKPGTLNKRADGKYTITTAQGALEVHGDGSYGYAKDGENNAAAGAKYVGWNLLEYPGESDRQDGLLHATFLVVITTPA